MKRVLFAILEVVTYMVAAMAFLMGISVVMLKEAKAQGAPKMLVCMEAAYAAGEAFEMKQAKKKLVYPRIDDYVFRVIIHKSMWIGYNSKTSQEAIQNGHDKCVESKIWKEMTL